jgi:RNA polymerase sigma factor (sigma-70 family)
MSSFLELFDDVIANDLLPRALGGVHRRVAKLIPFEDFVQDVAVRGLQRQHQFRGQSTRELLGWLSAIGWQITIDYFRKSHHESVLLANAEEVPARAESVEISLMRREQLLWLAKRLADLGPDDRNLLIRHYYRSEAFAQIARDSNLDPSTLIKRHQRILERLRESREG